MCAVVLAIRIDATHTFVFDLPSLTYIFISCYSSVQSFRAFTPTRSYYDRFWLDGVVLSYGIRAQSITYLEYV